MHEEPVGEPRPTGQSECREEPPGSGSGFVWEEVEQDYQMFDEHNNPVGPPVTKLEWINTEVPCQP